MDASQPISLKPGLYLVATPIGNLRDITLRALDVLRAVDVIACEDTRTSKKLLNAYGIQKKMIAYHDHNEEAQSRHILDLVLKQQNAVAIISDAGMPLISDPGYRLVRAALEGGVPITSLPGANAPLMALQLSGFPTHPFVFLGFLPPKSKARQDVLAQWAGAQATLVAFDTAPRLLATLEDVGVALGNRPVAVLREMTKLYEEGRRGSVEDLILFYTKNPDVKGEIVLVIGPPDKEIIADEDTLKARLKAALKTMGTKQASALVAQESGWKKGDVYKIALHLSGKA